jgi:hypothetical protein
MGLLYWGLILEALSSYEKKNWALIKKMAFKLKKKKKALLQFFLGFIKKHFGPYSLKALGDGLSGLPIGPALKLI